MLTKYLSVFLISMVPLIELRGAIPVGVAMGLPLWQVYVIAIIGNMLLFVGIPLPGTGAWTGTLAASLLDMDFKSSVRACMGGVLLAGCIMGALSVLGVSAFGAVAA